MQKMHGIIPQLFDCWADPVAKELHGYSDKKKGFVSNHP